MRQNVLPAPGPASTRRGCASASIAERWESDAECGAPGAVTSALVMGEIGALGIRISLHWWRIGYETTARFARVTWNRKLAQPADTQCMAISKFESYRSVDKSVYQLVDCMVTGVPSMPTTRISDTDHRVLQDLAIRTGKQHQEIIHEALDSYQRERLLDEINEGYARLRADKASWAELKRERRLLEEAGADGLGD
jgi:hypothetical protein